MSTLHTTITREDTEIQAEVSYTFMKGCRGHCDRYGAPEEPDEPDEIEVETVIDKATGQKLELTKEEEKDIEQQCWNYMKE